MNNEQKIAIITRNHSGWIGSYLAKELLERDYFVVGLRRRSSNFNSFRLEELGIFENKNLRLEYFDLNDPISINHLVGLYKPDEYYNFACLSHVRVSFDVPKETMSGIINGTLYALEAIKNLSPNTKFYHSGTSEMFRRYE